MKKTALVLAALLSVGSVGIARANDAGMGEKEECKLPPPYVGSAEFQKMKSLAGAWEAPNPMSPDGKMKVTYEVTSNGSAVVERMGIGTPFEMVSIYHDEKGKLAMTHYCAIGNQPRLALESSGPDQIKLLFSKNNVINPKKEDHMHSLAMTFLGPDLVRQEWSGYRGGKLEKPTVFTLTRVKEDAHTHSDSQIREVSSSVTR